MSPFSYRQELAYTDDILENMGLKNTRRYRTARLAVSDVVVGVIRTGTCYAYGTSDKCGPCSMRLVAKPACRAILDACSDPAAYTHELQRSSGVIDSGNLSHFGAQHSTVAFSSARENRFYLGRM